MACIIRREIIKNTITETDMEIKLYLSNVHSAQNTIPFINLNESFLKQTYLLTKYNVMSLLNIPETMEKYNHLLNLWAGSSQGESYLCYTKSRIIDMHSKDW